MGGSKSKPVVESARKVLEKRVLNDSPLTSSIKNVSLKYTPDNSSSPVAPSSSSSMEQSVLDEIEINNAMFKDMSKFPTIKTSTAYENQVHTIHIDSQINSLSPCTLYIWWHRGYRTIYLCMEYIASLLFCYYYYLYVLMGSMSDTLHYTSTTVDPIEETCTGTREDCCTHQDRTGADYEQQRSQQWKQADDTQRATHRESVDENVWKVQVSVHEKVYQS